MFNTNNLTSHSPQNFILYIRNEFSMESTDRSSKHLFLLFFGWQKFHCWLLLGKSRKTFVWNLALFQRQFFVFKELWWSLMVHTSNCFNARNDTDTMLTRFVVDFESTASLSPSARVCVCVRLYRTRKAKFCKYSSRRGVHCTYTETRISTAKEIERIKRAAHAFTALTQPQAPAPAPTTAPSLAMEKW